jgi:CDP-6-deoxy-D-xylo-4-hexulose-3-dehydrase
LRERTRQSIADYHGATHAHRLKHFTAGEDSVPVSGRVFGETELQALGDATLDFWLTAGRFNTEFEKKLAKNLGAPRVATVNSGSSANLVAVSALTSPSLEDRRLLPGDEIITVAAGFPTTVAPIFQNNLVPVFVDVDLGTYNVNLDALKNALSDKTRGVMLAHTLGNPFDAVAIRKFCDENQLWLVEDACDALGSFVTVKDETGSSEEKPCGSFGDLATFSFYPAHHITTGEGGAVAINRTGLIRPVESFRDWGRDCWCPPGQDNTCGKRFTWQMGDLPAGYDHKYIYSHLGYNLKMTDMQAAIGTAQMDRLPEFHRTRQRNFEFLYDALKDQQDRLILPVATPNTQPSWFGFPITLRPEAQLDRRSLMDFLSQRRIGTRMIFGGNLVHQPALADRTYRVSGTLTQSDLVMQHSFWIGCFPGLSLAHLTHAADAIIEWLKAQG